MRGAAVVKLSLLLSLVLSIAVVVVESRGGRRGGSLGGIFGGWRKHKKPTSSVNTRRITSGSPMHTPLTQPTSGKYGNGGLTSTGMQAKTQGSYPRQQMPSSSGYSYYGNGGAGAAQLPPGSTYYQTTSAIPTGAIYYPQPPMSSSGGTGNFLFGMMAGHVLSRGLYGHRSHAMYDQQPQQTGNGNDRIIIINNDSVANKTMSLNETETAPTKSPTEGAVDAGNENLEASIESSEEFTSSSEEVTTAEIPTVPPPYGIICVPIMLNETDPNDANQTIEVEKTVCYPAPPPPPVSAVAQQATGVECITRIVSEIDPLDPSKTIETPIKDCRVATTDKPPKVAGEIGESNTTVSPSDKEVSAV